MYKIYAMVYIYSQNHAVAVAVVILLYSHLFIGNFPLSNPKRGTNYCSTYQYSLICHVSR